MGTTTSARRCTDVNASFQGLSVYLFIFAFLGNFFYVASILSSPNLQLPEPEASAFIRETIPCVHLCKSCVVSPRSLKLFLRYLLGSGGTLMFDVTIVTQVFLYRLKGDLRGSRPSRTHNEEEAGLLSAEATGAEESIVTSRRRAGSVTRDGSVDL